MRTVEVGITKVICTIWQEKNEIKTGDPHLASDTVATMIQILPPNASALQSHDTEFLGWLEGADDAQVTTSPHGNEQMLMVEGIHLASAFEPEAEAEFICHQGIPEGSEEAWVYGTSPHMVEAALKRAKRIHVVGICARASAAQFGAGEVAYLSDPRVTVRSPLEETRTKEPRVICTAELRLAEPSGLRDSLLLELVQGRQQEVFQGRMAKRVEQGTANRAAFPDDKGVYELFGTGKSKAVVAAGGPSLPAGLAAIMSQRDDFQLVAVTTALTSIEAAGFKPDVVIAVDPQDALAGHLEAVANLDDWSDVPLVYALDVSPEVLRMWPGPRYAARLTLGDFVDIEPDTDFGTLFCAGTVTHTAADLARQMGADEIILMGADFAYPGGQTHAADAPFVSSPAQTHLDVLDVSGNAIPTSLNLLGYLRDLEDYIAQHPSVRFWNASSVGARIAGAERFAG